MVSFKHKNISITYLSFTFGEYGNEAHMKIAEEIQIHLKKYEEGKDFELYIGYGDDIANAMDLYNLRLLDDSKLRTLLNYFTHI
jgi:hypothetical protein